MITISKIKEAEILISERERLSKVLSLIPEQFDKITVRIAQIDIALNARTLASLVNAERAEIDSKLYDLGIIP